MKKNTQRGSATLLIVFISTTVVFAFLGVWALVGYLGQKSDVDGRVDTAVAEAKKEQADELEAKFSEREKEPNRQFAGPDDYGYLTFDYPKTWSVYVDKDATDGRDYEAYLNPGVVPSVDSNDARFAIHVLIETKDYDKVLSSYKPLVDKGDLKSSIVQINGSNATKLDGNFTKDIRGLAVLFKIRDKTVTISTDAYTFKKDFEKLISTIKFNQ